MQLKKGNPGHRSRAGLEAAAADLSSSTTAHHAMPTPPLTLTERELEIWRRLVDLLTARMTLKSSDHMTLARYCRYAAMWSHSSEDLADRRTKSGMRLTYKTPAGREYVRPGYRVMIDAEAKLLAIEREFGLTPSSRASVVARLADVRDDAKPPIASSVASQARQAMSGEAGPDQAPPSPIGMLASRSRVN